MVKIIFIAVLFCLTISGSAQTKPFEYKDTLLLNQEQQAYNNDPDNYQESVAEVEEPDILSDTTLYIVNINIPPETLKLWKNDRRMAYMHNLDSLLKQKQKEDLEKMQADNNGSTSILQKLISSGLLQGLFWMVALAFVFFILYKLFMSEGIFMRKSTPAPDETVANEDKVYSVAEYNKLLHQSILLGDYRLAVRYLFLKTLSSLHEKEYIQWTADKTNYQYTQELETSRKTDFSSLVLTYEYAWYGNFAVNAEMFTGIEKKFNTFLQKL